MILRRHIFVFVLTAGWLFATVLFGCSSAAPETASTTKKVVLKAADEPTFEVAGIHVLPRATEARTLPFVASRAGTPVEAPCLERNTKAKQWKTANTHVLATLRQNETRVSTSLLNWLRTDVLESLSNGELSTLKAVLYDETAMIRHFATDDVRFLSSQTCLSDSVRMLPGDNEVVTTLFGVTGFSLLGQKPISPELVKALKKAARKKGILVKAVPTFPRAKDKNKKPMFKKGKPLYQAPDGTLVQKKDVPLPKKRPVFELQFTVTRGVYVAVGNMDKARFVGHTAPPGCEINLIFDDMTPRVPECLGSSEFGFGVAMADNPGEVMVKVATQDATGQAVMPYNTTSMVQVGGSGFAWVTPQRLEEGAVLQVDTLVLHPQDSAPEDLKPFSYGK